MKKLHTEREFMERQEQQLFCLGKELDMKRISLEFLEDLIPGYFHLNDSENHTIKFMSKNFCNEAELSHNELINLPMEQYWSKVIHSNSLKHIFSQIKKNQFPSNGLSYTNYFQYARGNEHKPFELFFSTKKLLSNRKEFITISTKAELLGPVTKKIEPLLNENYFLKENLRNSSSLTKQEVKILTLIVNGTKRKDIANQLNISIHTYDTHRKRIREKLEAKSFADLMKYAEAFNLI